MQSTYKNIQRQNQHLHKVLETYNKEDVISHLVSSFLNKHNIKTKNKFILKYIKNDNHIHIDNFDYTFESIQTAFECLIDYRERNKHGVVYTPNLIVDYIVDKTIKKNTKSICDPACGTGSFLISAVKRLHKLTNEKISSIIENKIYGYDILDEHIEYTKLLLTLYMLYMREDSQISFNLKTCNSLVIDWNKEFKEGFDVVLGNPPYIRIQDISENEKIQLTKKWITCNGSYNIYFTFFELGMNILNKKGVLGYITANSFFTSFAGKTLRKWLQENRYIDKILDFTHLTIFNATSYTCIVFMNKKSKVKIGYNYIDNYNNLYNLSKIKFSDNYYSDINPEKWRLLRSNEREIIKKIESTGKPLGRIADIKSGIATLKDKIFFVPYSSKSLIEKIYNGKIFLVEKNITRNIIKISDLNGSKKVIPTHKIIFPYKKINNKYKLIPEKELKSKYPKCYEYLCHVKHVLASRDKGKKQYDWRYSYGRQQGFDVCQNKLLTPTFSSKPNFLLDNGDENAFFCNGYAIHNSKIPLNIIQKILNSKIMNYYITKTSVFVEGGYSCFQKNFIERFGIPEFSDSEIKQMKNMTEQELEYFLLQKYQINQIGFMQIYMLTNLSLNKLTRLSNKLKTKC